MLRPVCPDRVRHLERPFAPIPCRLLSQGHLCQMSTPAKLLYLLLSLAADRQGLSCFGERRICQELNISTAQLDTAKRELIAANYLAVSGRTYQLLPLPAPPQPAKLKMPATIPHVAKDSPTCPLPRPYSPMPEHVRSSLRRIFSRD